MKKILFFFLFLLTACVQSNASSVVIENDLNSEIILNNEHRDQEENIDEETIEVGENESYLYSLIASKTAEDCSRIAIPATACTGVFSNDDWIPVMREINNIDMMLVPAGCFMMGNEEGFSEEKPEHEVCFSEPFWIDKTEVTVLQFSRFLNDQNEIVDNYDTWLHVIEAGLLSDPIIQLEQINNIWYPMKRQDYQPLMNVPFNGATDYCEGRGGRLPRESEWEYSARGPNNYIYPWGDERENDKIFWYIYGDPDVGSIPEGASWVGALDMSGSVFEWTSTIYKPYPYDPNDGREAGLDVDDTSTRVFRGSPWYHDIGIDNVSATARFDLYSEFAYWYHGVRCAMSIDWQE